MKKGRDDLIKYLKQIRMHKVTDNRLPMKKGRDDLIKYLKHIRMHKVTDRSTINNVCTADCTFSNDKKKEGFYRISK